MSERVVIPTEIVLELRAARKQRYISQRALAKKIGYARSSLADAELGKLNPRLDLVLHWAEALGYEIVLRARV